jgi:lipid A 3-O-deacylase
MVAAGAAFLTAGRPAGFSYRLAPRGALAAILFALGIAATGTARAQPALPDDPLRLGPLGIMTQAPTLLDLGAGVYDLIGNAHRNETGAADAELRLGQRWGGLGPAVGTIIDARGGGMVYVGIDSDITVGPVVVTPLAGLGAWWRGSQHDENLGGSFEFRLSLEAAYAFESGSRLGLRFGHISNADIHNVNPGENDVMATYGLPLAL